jgi:hypothetical protein
VSASSFPLAGSDPTLMEKKPLDRPGNNLIDDILIASPFALGWVIDAQVWKIGRMTEAINMLGGFTRSARISPDGGIDDGDTHIGRPKFPGIEITSREIFNADTVGLADGPQRPFPNTDPSRVQNKLKLRAFRPESPILFLYRKRTHGAKSPNGVLLGVDRAIEGTAVDPKAGMLPVRRMW